MTARRLDFLIVGAGPAGLGAAHRLHELGLSDWLLLEGDDAPGGLSRSWRDEAGFTWDLGGHIIFSELDAFNRMLGEVLPDGLYEHERRAFVRLAGAYVPYPIQNNVHRLPEPLRGECLRGLEEAAAASVPASAPGGFLDWAARAFGRGLVEAFMLPYNRKLWCCDPGELSASWIGGRVARTDPATVLENARAGRDDVAWGPNRSFRFPKSGGVGAIWAALAGRLPAQRMRYGARVVGLDLRSRTCRLASGEELAYDNLVATLPLDELARMTGDPALAAEAGRLRHNRVDAFGFGISGRPPADLEGKCWMYFPEKQAPFYRMTVFSAYSPANVPDPSSQWSLLAEVAGPGGDQGAEPTWLKIKVIDRLKAEGLVPAGARIVSEWHRRAPRAYPLPTRDRDDALAAIVPALESRGVWPRGRLGSWRYEVGNMDHCFVQGAEIVGRIVRGEPETVLRPIEGGGR